MTPREQAARAITFFENTDEGIPHPADIRGARDGAAREEALQSLRKTQDFALLQAMTRAIGQRIETLEIAASAEFPPGVRVTVPEKRAYPRSGKELPGTVEETGTILVVRLDNGDTWEGPSSLARLGAS